MNNLKNILLYTSIFYACQITPSERSEGSFDVISSTDPNAQPNLHQQKTPSLGSLSWNTAVSNPNKNKVATAGQGAAAQAATAIEETRSEASDQLPVVVAHATHERVADFLHDLNVDKDRPITPNQSRDLSFCQTPQNGQNQDLAKILSMLQDLQKQVQTPAQPAAKILISAETQTDPIPTPVITTAPKVVATPPAPAAPTIPVIAASVAGGGASASAAAPVATVASKAVPAAPAIAAVKVVAAVPTPAPVAPVVAAPAAPMTPQQKGDQLAEYYIDRYRGQIGNQIGMAMVDSAYSEEEKMIALKKLISNAAHTNDPDLRRCIAIYLQEFAKPSYGNGSRIDVFLEMSSQSTACKQAIDDSFDAFFKDETNMITCYLVQAEVYRKLLAYYKNPQNNRNYNFSAPFISACRNPFSNRNYLAVVTVFLNAGVDVNADNGAALKYAAGSDCNHDVLRTLLDRGARVGIPEAKQQADWKNAPRNLALFRQKGL